ncbi:MAG: tRNA dihydrouridine synthase DusB [Oscillospiraceae bacterium]|nr:tRNA dihydrouridine synthase DusB [Oscillospiraceae bacterium]
MNIKNIKLERGLFLAPLAGVSDNAFRQVCREAGAEHTATEMISAKALNFRNAKTLELIKTDESELPVSVQIFGCETESMANAAKYLCGSLDLYKFSSIDINMGCPAPKITGGGDGSALMRNSLLAGKIMDSVVKAAEGYNIAVTVKIRSGWDDRNKNAEEIAKIAEESGISAVFIHGRTRERLYMPPVDLDIIRRVKNAVKIPVIGNGDIFGAFDAEKMLEYTKCDGIMIARGAFGNPWIFGEIAAKLENREYIPPTPHEKISVIKKHIDKMIFYKGERTALLEARKHLSWYIKGARDSAAARDKINRSSDYSEMIGITERVIAGGE